MRGVHCPGWTPLEAHPPGRGGGGYLESWTVHGRLKKGPKIVSRRYQRMSGSST